MESILNWFREIINSLNSDKKTGFCVKEILVFSIFVLVVIVAWYDILNGTNTIITGPDATDMSYPAYYFIANSFKHFSIPLWNPYSFAGIPYMGYPQVTIVYPLNLIFYFLFDFNIHTFGYIALFHILLAGWFTYLLGRYAFNFNRYISVTMGLIFMLSPNFTMLINGFNMLIPFTWFPLIFLFTYKSFTSNENYIRNAVLGGLFLGISFLSAMPMITMMFVISLYLFFVLTNIKRFKEIRRLTLSIVIIFVIGICLGSVWFMPNMEYMARSIRFLGAQGTTVGMQRMNVEAFTYHIVDFKVFGVNQAQGRSVRSRKYFLWCCAGVIGALFINISI
jgi:hypothetical protein